MAKVNISNKIEIKNKILEMGKEIIQSEGKKWKEETEIPFNAMLGALFGIRFGDRHAKKCLDKLMVKAGGKRSIPNYLRSLKPEELKELFSSEIKTGLDLNIVLESIKGIMELDAKYNLRTETLSHINDPDEFCDQLKKVKGFGGDEIGRWIVCEFVRTWELKSPSNLELPRSTLEILNALGLEPSDFKIEDYPYVDAAFETLGSKSKKLEKTEERS